MLLGDIAHHIAHQTVFLDTPEECGWVWAPGSLRHVAIAGGDCSRTDMNLWLRGPTDEEVWEGIVRDECTADMWETGNQILSSGWVREEDPGLQKEWVKLTDPSWGARELVVVRELVVRQVWPLKGVECLMRPTLQRPRPVIDLDLVILRRVGCL